jgi:uncharacterized protein (DUF433 family)
MQSGSRRVELMSEEFAMATATSWVSKNANRCGGDACIRDTRITVWGLESYRRLGLQDSEILRRMVGLTEADLDAAWEYVATNREEIDQAIHDNETGKEGLID